MSSLRTQSEPDEQSGNQVVLSHLVHRLLQREGGTIPLERVTLRVSDYVDISEQEAADLIDEGANDGMYTVKRSQSGKTTIAGVSPQGGEPQVITDAFGDPLKVNVPDFRIISVVTDSINDALHDAGYEDFTALANASTDDIGGLTGTLTESRAENLLKEAQRHVPVGHRLVQRAAAYYRQRSNPDTGRGEARVTDLSLVTKAVGEPLFLAARLQLPLDELIAKKLARGLVPIRIVGPRGSGKNYLLKYLCHKTNRGYQSLDVDRATEPEDLFGPLVPDGDVIVPRNGAVKQGLLNGDTIVINEFPVMQAGAAIALHRLLNEGTLLVKSHGELVEPHPSARLVITMNPPTREYRDSEPMNAATRGRFRAFEQPYIQNVEEEVETLDRQVNSGDPVVDRSTLRKIVQFAHKTRQNESWPTLSTRNLTILCEHIEDGATPKAAVKNELWAVAEPNQYPEDAHETLNDYL